MSAITQRLRGALAACLGMAMGACQWAGAAAAVAPMPGANSEASEPVASPGETDEPQVDRAIRAAIDRMAAFSRRIHNPQDLPAFDKEAVQAILGVALAERPPLYGALDRKFMVPPMDWTPARYRKSQEGGLLEVMLIGFGNDPGPPAFYTMHIDPERYCVSAGWLKKHLGVELVRLPPPIPLLSVGSQPPTSGGPSQAASLEPKVDDQPGGQFSTFDPYRLLVSISPSGCIVQLKAITNFKKAR